MRVAKAETPLLFALCVSILCDNGAFSRMTPEGHASMVELELPDLGALAVDARQAEEALQWLTPKERDTFGFGEVEDVAKIAGRSRVLALLDLCLDEWFTRGLPTS